MKNIDVRLHFLRQQHYEDTKEENFLAISYANTDNNESDICTKNIPESRSNSQGEASWKQLEWESLILSLFERVLRLSFSNWSGNHTVVPLRQMRLHGEDDFLAPKQNDSRCLLRDSKNLV